MTTEQLKGSSRYLSFPFRMGQDGGRRAARTDHIREQIAMLLFTLPGERAFLPDWGVGAQQLLFLPMTPELWSRIEAQLSTGVSEALRGEVQPGSIEVSAGPAPDQAERLDIVIRYKLAALDLSEEVKFSVAGGELLPPQQGEVL